jgi:predicted metal-dependent peptidase
MSDSTIIEKLTTARVGLLLKAPFFGNMATRMQLIDASDWCPTAATNGRNFYYNIDFVKKLSVKKLEFLFAHEILHCVFDHFGRVGSRDRMLSNIAQDYAVNQILVDERIGEKINEVQICLDSKYRGMAWEEIYDELYEKAEKISMPELLKQLGDLLDEHIKESEGAGSGGDKTKDGKDKPSLSKEEAQKIRDEIKQAMIQSAAAAGAGKTPAGIMRMIKDLTEPKMNWRQLVQQEIQSIVRNDFSFQRFNRKSAHSGAVLPGLKEDVTIDVAISIDMSGSIGTEEIGQFLGEVRKICDTVKPEGIDLLYWDTDVCQHEKYEQDQLDNLLSSTKPKGGGGTDPRCIPRYIKDHKLKPECAVVLTDGYVNEWGKWDCPTLWGITTDITSPIGKSVRVQ